MFNKLVEKILTELNLKVKKRLPSKKGYRNTSIPIITENNETLNIIIYKKEKGIKKRILTANSVSNYLFSKQIPTRKSLYMLESGNGRIIGIYNYLEGKTIFWEQYTRECIKELGKLMSDIHFKLNDFNDIKKIPDIKEVTLNTFGYIERYFQKDGVVSALKHKLFLEINNEKIEDIGKKIKTFESKDIGVLHMDFVRSNILFDSDTNPKEIVGVIDWEKVAFGPYIFDIARTLAFLLVDCKYKKRRKIYKYFIKSGYLKRGKNKNISLKGLDFLLDFYLLYDLYKFLLHNPYEFLNQNEHFLRTRDILVSRNILNVVQ